MALDWFQHWAPPSTFHSHHQSLQSHLPPPPHHQLQVLQSRPPQSSSEFQFRGPHAASQFEYRTHHPYAASASQTAGATTHQQRQPNKNHQFAEELGHNGIFVNDWQQQGLEVPPGIEAEKFETPKPQQGKYGQTSVSKLLPALLALGVFRGGAKGDTRGDQEAPGDPDRDLGGPAPLKTLYQWQLIDFAYKNNRTRQADIDSKRFIPINTLPLGIEAWRDRVFVTFPRWKEGVPCTLATVPRTPASHRDASPKLKPYPNWDFHRPKSDCSGLTSVFRINADRCGRLWVLDSGQTEALNVPKQICPPQIFVFNLTTDELIARYPIPEEHVRQNSLFSNIVTDIRDDKCDDVHVYFTDVWRFSILVFRLRDERFWRFNSHLFYPDPIASDYTLHDINFQWSDGVFGISLTPVDPDGDRTLFFHPMSSFREFTIPASVLRNATAANDTALLAKAVRLAGESRGLNGQSSAEAIDRNGVMFFNLVTQDAVGCWDIRKPYKRSTLGVVASDDEQLVFPNDLKVDSEPAQSVWVLSNKLPVFLYRQLDPEDINFRIMREYVDDAVAGTVCDPSQRYLGPITYEPECY